MGMLHCMRLNTLDCRACAVSRLIKTHSCRLCCLGEAERAPEYALRTLQSSACAGQF